jgi:hypothetical protein
MVTRAGEGSAVTGIDLSHRQLQVDFESSMGVVGGEKRTERANEQGRAAVVARR